MSRDHPPTLTTHTSQPHYIIPLFRGRTPGLLQTSRQHRNNPHTEWYDPISPTTDQYHPGWPPIARGNSTFRWPRCRRWQNPCRCQLYWTRSQQKNIEGNAQLTWTSISPLPSIPPPLRFDFHCLQCLFGYSRWNLSISSWAFWTFLKCSPLVRMWLYPAHWTRRCRFRLHCLESTILSIAHSSKLTTITGCGSEDCWPMTGGV